MAGFHKIRDKNYYFKDKRKMDSESLTSRNLLRAAIIDIHISQGLLETVKLKKKIRQTIQ